jgi:hypothetical protein
MCIEDRIIEVIENLLIDGGSIALHDDGHFVWSGNVAKRENAQVAAFDLLIALRDAPRAALIETIATETTHA